MMSNQKFIHRSGYTVDKGPKDQLLLLLSRCYQISPLCIEGIRYYQINHLSKLNIYLRFKFYYPPSMKKPTNQTNKQTFVMLLDFNDNTITTGKFSQIPQRHQT